MPPDTRMYFETLQARLISAVNLRVRNGELTERRLARMIGISQPHMHNLLKGARILSPQMGDRILKKLRMSVLDLCDPDEEVCRLRPECETCGAGGSACQNAGSRGRPAGETACPTRVGERTA